ncbi:MAG: neutral/alkaline non-lysosomal ceramidase N-terminal domain-containing protein [Deltaproteobacteria bacterium]|nr:neutral/alkaline non-lysosomal ceramidase N-terminal domain-containing protein [Deltaproteobacteria bacterium]MBW2256490.1 neutral/alkaline non-lysosomal ceramidase N-terminal domain-containing protein [Deltaproteobacteria bacterium]
MRFHRVLYAVVAASLFSCTEPESPEPGELQAGIARIRMPVPLGIGTTGYGPFGVTPNPTPFADIYPGTKRIHGHPAFEAVALSRGEDFEVVFLRSDTVGVFQQFRRGLVLELKDRTGRDFDDILMLGATHTHSGPGRVIDSGGPFVFIADTFFPEFYERMVDAMADVVEAAYADLAPARLGHAVAFPSEAHNDRRCEDGLDYTNSTAPLLALERDGHLEALLLSFAIHGTVLGIGDYTLSPDVHGAIEELVEGRFDHPVEVLVFNSWGADMSPGNPEIEGTGAPQPGGYDRMEAIGAVVADAVEEALLDVRWWDDPALFMETHRFRIDREVIGYEPGVFPYDYGAVYCGSSTEADCDPSTIEEGIDQACISFTEEFPAPNQTVVSVGQVGDVHFVTWPGEPGTLLAEQVLQAIEARAGVSEVMFFGYAQDYNGYAILEEDWWQGGYEASGALWGPKQGEYMRDRLVEAFDVTHQEIPLVRLFDPPPVPAFEVGDYTPFQAATPVALGEVVVEVQDAYGPTDVITFAVAGHDPWLGAPVATLAHDDGTPVLRSNGLPVDSDGYAFWVDLTTDPAYHQTLSAPERAFHWTFHLPATRAVPGYPLLDGSYRLVARLADGTEVQSALFTVDP